MKRTKLHNQLKTHSTKPIKKEQKRINPDTLVPMGSTLLNLAMSDHIEGGAQMGKMINIIGASHGGKTVLALTTFAELNIKPSFSDYHFIYDDVERANSFDMPRLFGEGTAKRIENPRSDKEETFSVTTQHFHANILHWLKKKVPFVYIVDSWDALDAIEDQKKINEMVTALEKEKEITGTYGMAKAKSASSILRNIVSGLSNSKSVLFIISQTRDNIDPMSYTKETRSGGRALKFYAHHEMWLSAVKSYKKNDTIIGHRIKIKITKNKLTGKVREVEFDVYEDYGIDDIGSCIDYLISKERWSGGGSAKINHNKDFNFENCTKSKLISLIEKDSKNYTHLKNLVREEWMSFEESLKLNRKSKYS